MFSLNPNGDGSSSSSASSSATGWAASKGYFFGKFIVYFVAVRLLHVYWGAASEENKAIAN
jgi:hypothetical protein